MRLGTACVALAIVAGSSAFAQGGRYELVPEPDVRQTSTNRVTSAYVIDKKANQFWICTARYNFRTSPPIMGTVSSSRAISAGHR
jgi:hypothetical protein